MPIKKAIDIEEQTVSLTFENGNSLVCALADLSLRQWFSWPYMA